MLLSVRIALGHAGLHVNMSVRRADGHRLVRNVDFHRVQPVRRRHRNNRRVHVHGVRARSGTSPRQTCRVKFGIAVPSRRSLTVLMPVSESSARTGAARCWYRAGSRVPPRTKERKRREPRDHRRAQTGRESRPRNQRYGGGGSRDNRPARHRIRAEAAGCVESWAPAESCRSWHRLRGGSAPPVTKLLEVTFGSSRQRVQPGRSGTE